MPKITAEIPEKVYRTLSEEVRLGIFSDTSEAICSSLRKTYAGKSRACLKWLMEREGIREADLLKELTRLRK